MKGKIWKNESAAFVSQAVDVLLSLPAESFSSVPLITQALDGVVTKAKVKNPQLFSPLRYLLTGVTAGIGVPVIITLLGKETTLKRLQNLPTA
jgi:glutamyl/glutaminyl-tRNA synthetase